MYEIAAVFMAVIGGIRDKIHGKRNQANLAYLKKTNFELIRDDPKTDALSPLWIGKTERKLTFSREPSGYKLFFLILEDEPDEGVILRGLDGYGLRDREFLNVICRLIDALNASNEVQAPKDG